MKSAESKKTFFSDHIVPYYSDVYRYTRALCCDEYLSEDVSQCVMEKAWIRINQVEGMKNIKGWLFKVALNEVRMYFRAKRPSLLGELSENAKYENTSNRMEDLADFLEKAETTENLKKAMDLLDDKYKCIFRLRYACDMRLKDIASVLGLNYNTTKVLWHRGIQQLRKLYYQIENNEQIKK